MPIALRTHLSTLTRFRKPPPQGERERASAARRGYDRRWRRFRRWFLNRHPLCAVCQAAATDADHIIPLSHGGAHCDEANTEALCKPCHSRKTRREQRTGSNDGRDDSQADEA